MAKPPSIETLLKNGSAEWNRARKTGAAGTVHTGATFANLFSANADLSALDLVGSEWEKCDLSKMNFRDSDLSNSYFHGGRLQDCDFRGANLEGATFERLKLLRCDFTGARGLEEIEFDEVDMDRVSGLDGQEAPPPPPPPAVGITSFTRDQRLQRETGSAANAEMPIVGEDGQELPEFRPQDPPGQLLYRELKKLPQIPMWALDVPGLRPHLPPAAPPGSTLESALREASRQRLEGRKPSSDPAMVTRAQQALRMGSKDAAFAAGYLRETATEPNFRFSSAKALHAALKAELDVDDLTASVDPRITGAMLELGLSNESADALNEVRRRLGATQLFTALLEAGFNPDNNWEEALDSAEQAQDLAALAGGSREELAEAFQAFTALPEEARLRRLAYLGEAATHLEQLSRMTAPEGEPSWLAGPEYRECDDREMQLVEVLKAQDIPAKVPALAKAELGVPEGQVPEESEDDLFLHFKCAVCGKEKLIVQTPE